MFTFVGKRKRDMEVIFGEERIKKGFKFELMAIL
jgi:hypothetical protein